MLWGLSSLMLKVVGLMFMWYLLLTDVIRVSIIIIVSDLINLFIFLFIFVL